MLDSVVCCGLVAKPKSKGKAINVGVPETVHAALAEYAEKRNLILRDTVGAIGAFFMAQPSPIKRIMLGDVDPELQSAYADFLERMLTAIKQPAATPAAPATDNNQPEYNPHKDVEAFGPPAGIKRKDGTREPLEGTKARKRDKSPA